MKKKLAAMVLALAAQFMAACAFAADLTVFLPAKPGKFSGCCKHLILEWNGTEFTHVYEM